MNAKPDQCTLTVWNQISSKMNVSDAMTLTTLIPVEFVLLEPMEASPNVKNILENQTIVRLVPQVTCGPMIRSSVSLKLEIALLINCLLIRLIPRCSVRPVQMDIT
jgi:hypothetical protein